ncbi:DUF4397 domain-containing protein [Haloarcula sp. JP-L23]|uniref:DUF4397 domain-containing protein n=1 Tax=Haloarcula sp. JP-L23 TaxID=2716717 RepID=UPI00140EDF1C|nr:DUF4397 domain-containing protein [Haloarcula sp. JP-L23]
MADSTLLRIGHCCPDASNVDVSVDGTTRFAEVEYATLSDYATVGPGDHEVAIAPAGSVATVVETTVSLSPDAAYTVLATGLITDIEATALRDDSSDIPPNVAHVRLVHTSPDAPSISLDVGETSSVVDAVDFREASEYRPVEAGTYDLSFRPTDRGRVEFELDDITFDGGTAYSAIALGQLEAGTFAAVVEADADELVAPEE